MGNSHYIYILILFDKHMVNYKKGMASHEHEETIFVLCQQFNLKKPALGTTRRTYNPDIIDDDTDYEVEMVPSTNKIKDKAYKWDKNRKKVLILRPILLAYEYYDEIYAYSDKEVVRLK